MFAFFSTSLSAKQFRDLLARKYGVDSGLAMIIKQRAKANEIDRMDLVGNVQGSDCILGESAVHVFCCEFCLFVRVCNVILAGKP